MPNRLTRVPDGSPPALPGGPAARAVVAMADAFMVAMVSRPATGSLRNTWVTPATFWLSVLTGLVAAALLAVAASAFTGWVRPAAALLGLLLLLGAGSVFAVGVWQRRRS